MFQNVTMICNSSGKFKINKKILNNNLISRGNFISFHDAYAHHLSIKFYVFKLSLKKF